MRSTVIDQLILDTLSLDIDVYNTIAISIVRHEKLPVIRGRIKDKNPAGWTASDDIKCRLLDLLLHVVKSQKVPIIKKKTIGLLQNLYHQILFYQSLRELPGSVDHVVVSVGSNNQPHQQFPQFAKDDATGNTLVLNVDPVFHLRPRSSGAGNSSACFSFTLEDGDIDSDNPSQCQYFRFALNDSCQCGVIAGLMPKIFEDEADKIKGFFDGVDTFSSHSLEHFIGDKPRAITVMTHLGRKPDFTFLDKMKHCQGKEKHAVNFISSYEGPGPVVVLNPDLLWNDDREEIGQRVGRQLDKFYTGDGLGYFFDKEKNKRSKGVSSDEVQGYLSRCFSENNEKQTLECGTGVLCRSLDYITASDLTLTPVVAGYGGGSKSEPDRQHARSTQSASASCTAAGFFQPAAPAKDKDSVEELEGDDFGKNAKTDGRNSPS